MTFGAAVRWYRDQAKYTQAHFAAAIGVTQGMVSQVEKGERPAFSLDKIKAAERLLGLPAGKLVSYLPSDHPAHALLTTEVPDFGLVWGSRTPPDVPEPVPGKVFSLTGRFPPGTFVLKVSGHSVFRYGVYDGDYIAVRPTCEPESGKLVVARQGNAYTLKGCRGNKLFSFQDGDREPVEMDTDEPYETVGVMIEVVCGEREFTPKPIVVPLRKRHRR